MLSSDDQHKQWLTSPETLSCCSCMLTAQFRIFTTNQITNIGTFTPYQTGVKAERLRKNGTFFLKNPIWRTELQKAR